MSDRNVVSVEEFQAVLVEAERELKRPVWLSERVQSLNELNHEDIPELEWVVPELLTEGITVLAGMLKTGKSMLILNIGLAIAEGLPVLGQTEAKNGRVLYITLDDKQKARLRARARALRMGRENDIPFDIATAWPILTEGGTEQIGEYLEYYPDTRMLVIDVLMNVLPDIREGADAYSEIYQKLEPLKALAHEHHVAIVLIMHMNKGGQNGGNPRNRIYGSMAYRAIADNILLLDEDYTTHQRYLMTSGKDLDQGRYAMAYETNTGRYTYGEERTAQLQELKEARTVDARVRDVPGSTYSQLVRWLVAEQGISENTAQQRVSRAVREGKICKDSEKKGYFPCLSMPTPVETSPDPYPDDCEDCDPD